MKITGVKNNNTTTKGFLLCFRPFPVGDDATTINELKSFSAIEKPKPKSSSKVYSSDKESIDTNQKKTARRRVLSKIVKAMAFQSSLSKKVRNGKITQDPHFRNQKSRRRSSSSSSSEEENDSSLSSSILSSSSSSSLSLSSSSSIASSWNTSSSDSSRSLGSLSGRQKSFRSDSIEDEKKKQNIISTSTTTSTTTTENQKKKISGICLLLISLFVLILWGKFFAIICTSTWFYFVSTTRGNSGDGDGDNERQMLIKLPVDIQSKEDKKRIIMEGFLERRRNHRGVFHHHQH